MRKAWEPNDKLDRATDKTLAEADRKALHVTLIMSDTSSLVEKGSKPQWCGLLFN